jgi:hypothetical protein
MISDFSHQQQQNPRDSPILPNKHVLKFREAFEKLRKEELLGKVLPYNLLFLSNKYLKEAYQLNFLESQKLLKTF